MATKNINRTVVEIYKNNFISYSLGKLSEIHQSGNVTKEARVAAFEIINHKLQEIAA